MIYITKQNLLAFLILALKLISLAFTWIFIIHIILLSVLNAFILLLLILLSLYGVFCSFICLCKALWSETFKGFIENKLVKQKIICINIKTIHIIVLFFYWEFTVQESCISCTF